MKEVKERLSSKGKATKTSPEKRKKRLSAIAKFWATEYVDGEIIDMRAVLR
ncbi:hypothetical protein FACS189464_0830 [Bacteroidia bacterium]|nr:hypothetical protein FACS189464_0830 [Bacteroidia bacterium]